MSVILSIIISFIVYLSTFKIEIDTTNKKKGLVIVIILMLLCLVGAVSKA